MWRLLCQGDTWAVNVDDIGAPRSPQGRQWMVKIDIFSHQLSYITYVYVVSCLYVYKQKKATKNKPKQLYTF